MYPAYALAFGLGGRRVTFWSPVDMVVRLYYWLRYIPSTPRISASVAGINLLSIGYALFSLILGLRFGSRRLNIRSILLLAFAIGYLIQHTRRGGGIRYVICCLNLGFQPRWQAYDHLVDITVKFCYWFRNIPRMVRLGLWSQRQASGF